MTIYEIIESIAANPSTNAKLEILKNNSSNDILKNVFYYAYNPRFNFWVKTKVLPRVEGTNDIDTYTFVVLNTLINREVTGDAARSQIERFMETLTAEAQEILVRIINHDLRCGASDTLASKVWKNLVPEYPVMLCDKFNVKTEKYLKQFEGKDAFNVSKKEDGGRVLITVDESGEVTIRSRNGSTLNAYKLFDKYFSTCNGNVFDGELVIVNEDGTPNRKLSNGIYTKLVRNTATQEEVNKFSIVIWDVIPLNEYLSGEGTKPYSYRLNELNNFATFWNNSPIRVVENKNVSTLEECFTFYDHMRSLGQEGAIIKVASAVWEDKRSKNSIKLKNESEGDFLCTGVEEGTGKYEGMIGALKCESSCGKLKFSVGTGLKDDDRLKDPSYYIGFVHEVKYNEVISSKGRDTKSLFLPVYVQRRDDKNIANSLGELK